jgi:hypothetical protein
VFVSQKQKVVLGLSTFQSIMMPYSWNSLANFTTKQTSPGSILFGTITIKMGNFLASKRKDHFGGEIL